MPIGSRRERKRGKEQAARDLLRVRAILREWDPIGVFPDMEGGPRDEYDSYAPRILRMLEKDCTAQAIVRQLQNLRVRWMELPLVRDRDEEIAARLLAWRHSQHEGRRG